MLAESIWLDCWVLSRATTIRRASAVMTISSAATTISGEKAWVSPTRTSRSCTT